MDDNETTRVREMFAPENDGTKWDELYGDARFDFDIAPNPLAGLLVL